MIGREEREIWVCRERQVPPYSLREGSGWLMWVCRRRGDVGVQGEGVLWVCRETPGRAEWMGAVGVRGGEGELVRAEWCLQD